MRSAIRVAILVAIVALTASACGGTASGPKPTVKIGSTNFYEQGILAEAYAQILEANGYTVERKFNLGNREIVQPAIESGQIDMDAECLATPVVFGDKTAKASTDPKATQTALQTALDGKKLTVLDFAAATDQNGFVVTKDTQSKYNLKKLSDIAAGSAQGQLVLGGPAECPSRPFCKVGLEGTYGIKFKDFKPLDAGGPLTVTALDGKAIDLGLLFTSAAVASWGDGGECELFAIHDDGELRDRYWDGASWHAWESLGSGFTGQPAAAARSADRIDVLAFDRAGVLRHRWWDGTRWVEWHAVPGAPSGDRVSCAWSGDRLDVVVTAPTGALW